jgi:hypothetical protein
VYLGRYIGVVCSLAIEMQTIVVYHRSYTTIPTGPRNMYCCRLFGQFLVELSAICYEMFLWASKNLIIYHPSLSGSSNTLEKANSSLSSPQPVKSVTPKGNVVFRPLVSLLLTS